MWRPVRRKKHPRLKLPKTVRWPVGKGPSWAPPPSSVLGLPGATRHQRKHHEAEQEPCKVHQCLLRSGRGVRSWRVNSGPHFISLSVSTTLLPAPEPPRALTGGGGTKENLTCLVSVLPFVKASWSAARVDYSALSIVWNMSSVLQESASYSNIPYCFGAIFIP